MDRSREARRGVTLATSNGLSRRRHRSGSLRDSPEEDGPLELQETARLRDRKKDRDRERERDRDRDIDRDRERDRISRSSKRRRSDKFMLGTNRDDGGDDSSEESVNDDEEDDDDDGGGGGNSSIRTLPPNPSTSTSSMLNLHHHHHHHHHNHNSNSHSNNNNNNHNNHNSRKSFPPLAKVFRTAPTATTAVTTTSTSTWKVADEMIGVSVPRKARSASTKRSHECWTSSGGVGGGGEQIQRQASSSPVRTSVATALATSTPIEPSSIFSVRKKMKPSGPKLRPPKSSSNKSSSSAQDEIEIEIAEVLYGMRQPQGPSQQEIMGDLNSKEINNNNKSTSDSKSRVSSPISNSPSTLPQSSSILPTNSSTSTAPMSAIAPKRKRPRPVKYEDENPSSLTVRNVPISSTTKVELDQSSKTETCSSNLDKNSGSAAAENGSTSYDVVNSQASEPKVESVKPENNLLLPDSNVLIEESECGRDVAVAKDGPQPQPQTQPQPQPQSPKKECTASLRLDDDCRDHLTVTRANSTTSEIENQREEKFQIDLMAPPPSRSSPEIDGEIDCVAVHVQREMKPVVDDDEKVVKVVKEDIAVEGEQKKAKTIGEESESQKPVVEKERNIDLQLDLEKNDRDSGTVNLNGNKLQQNVQKQQQQQQPTSVPEKNAQSTSLSLPLTVAGWPGGLPPMGYMGAPLQGVVSMDGSAVSSASIQPPNLLFSQPRPKRCATHCYIARNIHYLQQFTRMNPFWPAAAGSASLYGAMACNLNNVVPPSELHGTAPGKGVNDAQDKEQGLAIFPGPSGKDNKVSQHANILDSSQRKVLIQQALPPGAPSNILAPAFTFPLSQHQASAAAVQPGSVSAPPAAANAASSSGSNSVSVSATATAGAAATAMGLNYPKIPGNETQTQYFAILQNGAYPFPMSGHMGATPVYRGTNAQSMPFFSGSFYSSQMLHPSQLQQQQQPVPTQSHQSQQGLQNASISNGSSSSQKHLQSQHPKLHNGSGSGGGTLQGFPAPKNQPSQQLQLQPRQQQQNQQVPHQSRQLENEMGGEESPSTADSRASRANMTFYGQNFPMVLHPPNFALMTTTSMGGASSLSGNYDEKKPQQQLQQQGTKVGVETMMPQTFAMTFASINGTAAPGVDLSTIAQNPAIFQSYQYVAAAQAAQQKKNYGVSDEGKAGGSDTSNVEEERKPMAGKPPATVGPSIAFSRPDLANRPVSAMTGNTVVDGSTRSLNLGSEPARTTVSVMPSSIRNDNASPAQQQLQRSQHQQQQMIQLQKQQFVAAAAAVARSKIPATSNGSVYPDHLQPSTSMAAKFPGASSVFPQNFVQNNRSSVQSPQWKNSGRTTASQVSSQSLAPSTTSSHRNLPQQQGRTQQSHTQISFAANPKSSAATQGQPPSGNNQSASPPVLVGSPATSISKTSAGGSPRTCATASTGNRSGQASSLSSQQTKNSPSVPSRKSSPVPSILGNPVITSPGTGVKPQMSQQHQQQQQISKHAIQQAQLLFSNACMQAQPQSVANTTSSTSAGSGFFTVRHRDQQQLPGTSGTSSAGILSLCPPVTHSNSSTSDPAKAVAAATNIKTGPLTSQGLIHAANFANAQASGKPHQPFPPGFSYVHAVPTAVQVKPAEQKQPASE